MNLSSEYPYEKDLLRAAFFMDLQWFSDSQGGTPEEEGRTHDPTDVTYRKAREEGRVAKSQELIAAMGLLFPAIAIFIFAPWMIRICTEMLSFIFTRITELDPLTDRVTALIFFNYFARLALPVLFVAVIAALFSNWLQVGFLFSTKPIEPQFSKILPKFARYFKRIFSMDGLYNLGKSIIKLAIIGSVAFFLIRWEFHQLVNLQKAGLWTSITIIASLAGRLLIIVALLLLILSIPDIIYQKWQFKQSLKMTREKYKEELKQDEGDPMMRNRLRHRYRELLSQNMLNEVPKANVVITNPTHYSVALEYDADRMEAPTVIAKGEDDIAMRIREIAKAHNVPVVSHPAITRAIYDASDVGDQIPRRFWEAVALVVGKFFNYNETRGRPARERMGA